MCVRYMPAVLLSRQAMAWRDFYWKYSHRVLFNIIVRDFWPVLAC